MPTTALVRGLIAFLLGFTLVIGVMGTFGHSATTILPPGATCFQQATGPVSSGSVYMLVPSTTTPKNTWQDSGQVTLNTNPIQLDANGCAIIFGTGSYRQQVYTGPVIGGLPSGNLLYDVQTTDTSAPTSVFWAGTAAGTANAIAITDAGFNNTDGAVINFLALNTNTGAATLNVSGGGAIAIKVPSATGPIAITSGCITGNNPISVVYSATQNAFLLLTACSASATAVAAVPSPGGYLTLASDTSNPIITADVLAATTVFYTTYTSNQIPIWNGTAYSIFTFTQLQLTLSASNNTSNAVYDVCVFSNSGVPTLVTGPSWSNSAAGTSSRGTGAGSTQISRVNGIWVNTVQITGNNGASTFTVPANQCTYVGSILIDQAAGQVSNFLSFGQNRKWGVWNAYNRAPLQIQAGDPTQSWTNAVTGWRASNATGGNAITTLTGLAEQQVPCTFVQSVRKTNSNANTFFLSTGIAVNVGNITPTGKFGSLFAVSAGNAANGGDAVALNYATNPLGVTTFTSVEAVPNDTGTLLGTSNGMVLQCNYRG